MKIKKVPGSSEYHFAVLHHRFLSGNIFVPMKVNTYVNTRFLSEPVSACNILCPKKQHANPPNAVAHQQI